MEPLKGLASFYSLNLLTLPGTFINARHGWPFKFSYLPATGDTKMSADQVDGVHPSDQNILLQDPMRAWDRISDAGLYGTWARGTVEFPNGGHLQGIQRGVAGDRPYLVLSGSSDTESYFVTLVFDSDKEAALSEQSAESVHYPTISKDPLRHAGGIQLIGDILVVGAEDNEGKNHSAVFFYDLSNPRVPKELKVKVERLGEPYRSTAGAVGIVKQEDRHILAVATWDADTIDFYTSNGLPLCDEGCQFNFMKRWEIAAADKTEWIDQNWGHYQGLNLFSDMAGNLYAAGFNDLVNADWMDLYALNLAHTPDKMLVKVGKKRVALTKGSHFRYGGGLWLRSSDELVGYATERNVGDQTHLGELWVS